jgi:hypothetical protein
MRNPREEVFAALFALAKLANTPATPFAVMSRRFVPWSQKQNLEGVELYQLQLPQHGDQKRVGGATTWNLKAIWFVYAPVNTDDLITPTSPVLNNYMDALEAALLTNPGGNLQTLGGLVTNACIDGEVMFDEGLLAPPALLAIPITINTGI